MTERAKRRIEKAEAFAADTRPVRDEEHHAHRWIHAERIEQPPRLGHRTIVIGVEAVRNHRYGEAAEEAAPACLTGDPFARAHDVQAVARDGVEHGALPLPHGMRKVPLVAASELRAVTAFAREVRTVVGVVAAACQRRHLVQRPDDRGAARQLRQARPIVHEVGDLVQIVNVRIGYREGHVGTEYRAIVPEVLEPCRPLARCRLQVPSQQIPSNDAAQTGDRSRRGHILHHPRIEAFAHRHEHRRIGADEAQRIVDAPGGSRGAAVDIGRTDVNDPHWTRAIPYALLTSSGTGGEPSGRSTTRLRRIGNSEG